MTRPTIDHIDRDTQRMNEIVDPPKFMWAKWRRIVLDQAPDLAEMLGVAK